jgi:hypothetical protein
MAYCQNRGPLRCAALAYPYKALTPHACHRPQSHPIGLGLASLPNWVPHFMPGDRASITASATFGHSASPDNVTGWHIISWP